MASYWNHALGGSFSPSDLRVGERLLIDCGLVTETEQVLFPSRFLSDLLDGTLEDARVAIFTLASQVEKNAEELRPPNEEFAESLGLDASRREELLVALGRRFDDRQRRLIGDIGERVVLYQARVELESLGYIELAREVRRVSALSDQLGYDISAPRVNGPSRLIEVKSTLAKTMTNEITFFLSRGEAEFGATVRDWFLVVCEVEDSQSAAGTILGWCTMLELGDRLPKDSVSGRWEQASVNLPRLALIPGLPSP